jgi:hypothetical protein
MFARERSQPLKSRSRNDLLLGMAHARKVLALPAPIPPSLKSDARPSWDGSAPRQQR